MIQTSEALDSIVARQSCPWKFFSSLLTFVDKRIDELASRPDRRPRTTQREARVRRSEHRIVTTHVGSLSRPPELLALNAARASGEADAAAYAEGLASAVAEVVTRQSEIGIDIPNDGEFGKPMSAAYDYGALPAPPDSAALAAHWRPWIETCITLFGAERCLFESNFPVEKMGIGYAALWNALKRIAADASADEKKDLFSGTARRAYRLD